MPLVINGETVDDALVREEAAALRGRYEEMVQDLDPVAREMQLRDWSRENVIERVLLRQAALREGVDLADAPAAVPEAEIPARIQRLIDRISSKIPAPKPKEIAELYRKNKERFWGPEMVRASHIVKNVDENTSEAAARDAIEKCLAELKAGGNFAAIADRESDCPGSGGDLGWIAPGQMVDEFDTAVFALKPGEISGVFRTVFGFHLAKVYERRPAGIRNLADIKDELEAAILRERRERALEEFVDGLKARAVIQNVRAR